MASKRRLRRQKLAAARNEGVKVPKEKIRVRWDAQNAVWVDEKGNVVKTAEAATPKPEQPKQPPKAQALFLYNVAVQKGKGKDIVCNEFMAPSDEEVIELICKHHSVDSESEFTLFDVHKVIPANGGIQVIREGPDWPKGVKTVTHRGIIMHRQWNDIAQTRRQALKDAAAATTTKTTASTTAAKTTPPATALPWKVEGESYIPRVKYTLLTGS